MSELTIEQVTRIYNIGYNAGHDDTVEACAMPAHYAEMDEHHRDVVQEILLDFADARPTDKLDKVRAEIARRYNEVANSYEESRGTNREPQKIMINELEYCLDIIDRIAQE